ncbi:pullulanase [Breznakia sp. PF5-3]|uniref:type I pullulanase n=1 Tax=unclassified Breznakia TaxID=2623764 RepID=UPI00240700FA|nr:MULTISPECIES: type I pullulanase [unclassified Breznakia]MDF9824567.1 pullulanase [Breznakia sp. PM6-1]MDF9835457.1 pullulanase [Breznakia sp. PF5-3]MDF9837867.1 pullulanase [Breznakia sp. PFB2-8]MDF9859840.1 pullulanase [Breznakia sp. PH5-24]
MRRTRIFEAYLDDFNLIRIYRKKDTYAEDKAFFYMEDCDNKMYSIHVLKTYEQNEYCCFECFFNGDIQFGKQYEIINEHGRKTSLIFADIVKSERFDQMFYYKGSDLGCTYMGEQSVFKVWAPTAYDMYLEVYDHGVQIFPMERSENGVYTICVKQDLKNKKYLYLVSVNGEIHRALDPYAKAVDINSKHSVVIDVPNIRRDYDLPTLKTYCDAIIYEASVRDFTLGKTFKSFTEENNEGTGFSYVKNLGITHIQLLPTFDFSGVNESNPSLMYNWGYDVNQWMALENSYSSNLLEPIQGILDLQNLVNKCHEVGIRVNLDVVYNHVFELETSCLQQLVPFYYFQLHSDHTFSNATMCGNDIDSKRLMCRKLIVDSCMYLIDTFNIDGLRFDLMGILDIETMNKIVAEAKLRKLDFMIYGEGWNMPSTLPEKERATIDNNWEMPQVAHFSDVFRDVIKGKQIDKYLEYGYALGNTGMIYQAMNVLSASVGDFGYRKVFTTPMNVINYVECHDNMTSWDQIDAAMDETEEDKVKRHKMLLAFVLLAQGIPFLQSGQEFLRTKYGHNNTYNLGDDINHIDYNRKDKYIDVVNYTKDLIAIRKQHMLFRMNDVDKIYHNIYYEHISERVLFYILEGKDYKLQVVFNPTREKYTKVLDEEWEIIFYNGKINGRIVKKFDIFPLDVIILKVKKEETE